MAKPKGFDGNKRWGNSAVVGHGVNSPAMMEARSKKAKALKKRTMVKVRVNKTPDEIGHTITDHKGRVLEHYEPKKK